MQRDWDRYYRKAVNLERDATDSYSSPSDDKWRELIAFGWIEGRTPRDRITYLQYYKRYLAGIKKWKRDMRYDLGVWGDIRDNV